VINRKHNTEEEFARSTLN